MDRGKGEKKQPEPKKKREKRRRNNVFESVFGDPIIQTKKAKTKQSVTADPMPDLMPPALSDSDNNLPDLIQSTVTPRSVNTPVSDGGIISSDDESGQTLTKPNARPKLQFTDESDDDHDEEEVDTPPIPTIDFDSDGENEELAIVNEVICIDPSPEVLQAEEEHTASLTDEELEDF